MDNRPQVLIVDLNIDQYQVQRDAARIAIDYLNDLQKEIEFLTAEPYKGRDLPVRATYEPRLLLSYIPDPMTVNYPTIYICNLPLNDYGYMSYDDRLAFVTLSDYHEMGKRGLPLDTYIAFHVAKVIAHAKFPTLKDGQHHRECPMPNWRRGDLNSRLNIHFGRFCSQCLAHIRHLVQTKQVPPGTKDALDFILYRVSKAVHEAGFRNPIPYDAGLQESAINISESGTAEAAMNLIVTGAPLRLAPVDAGAIGDRAQGLRDSLGYESYAKIFADFIAHDKTETPLAIALSARWGRGKTFLADLIHRELEKKNIECIWFNAWYHAKATKVWFHFCSYVLDEIVRSMGYWEQIKFHTCRFLQSLKKIVENIIVQPVIWLAFALPVVIVVVLLWPVFQLAFDQPVVFAVVLLLLAKQWVLAISGLLGISILSLLWYAARWAWRIMPRSALRSFVTDPYSQKTVFETIERFCAWHNRRHSASRIVIFVDDIDRCPPDEMVGVLEVIQLFLRLDNAVFVVPLDAGVVCTVIGERFKFADHLLRGAIGREYLEKIIQIPFHIPEPDKVTFVKFMQELFAFLPSHAPKEYAGIGAPGRLREVAASVALPSGLPAMAESAEEMQDWEIQIIEEITRTPDFALSPRLAKRFRNIYFLSRKLLSKYPIEVTPDLARSFIKWLGLSIQFPEETKALHEWFVFDQWQPFPREGILWLRRQHAHVEHFEVDSGKLKDDCHLAHVDTLRFRSMMDLYLNRFHIDNAYLEKTEKIYNCFNLILD